MKKLGQAGKCWDDGREGVQAAEVRELPGYENGLPFVARRYCGLWGRGTNQRDTGGS